MQKAAKCELISQYLHKYNQVDIVLKMACAYGMQLSLKNGLLFINNKPISPLMVMSKEPGNLREMMKALFPRAQLINTDVAQKTHQKFMSYISENYELMQEIFDALRNRGDVEHICDGLVWVCCTAFRGPEFYSVIKKCLLDRSSPPDILSVWCYSSTWRCEVIEEILHVDYANELIKNNVPVDIAGTISEYLSLVGMCKNAILHHKFSRLKKKSTLYQEK